MTATHLSPLFDKVVDAILDAELVAFDGCHKIYLALDVEQADWFRDEYPHIVEGTATEMLDAVEAWWDESCGLRFVSGVRTVDGNPNDGFIRLIAQGADWNDDNDEDDDI